jgi:hypothetical protein
MMTTRLAFPYRTEPGGVDIPTFTEFRGHVPADTFADPLDDIPHEARSYYDRMESIDDDDYLPWDEHDVVAELKNAWPAPNPNERTILLEGAEQAVNGPRNTQYGDPTGDFTRTAQMWSAYVQGVFERKIQHLETTENGFLSPSDLQALMLQLFDNWDVAAMMNLLKQSRISWTPWKQDSWMDTAGYAACGWDCASRDDRAVRN